MELKVLKLVSMSSLASMNQAENLCWMHHDHSVTSWIHCLLTDHHTPIRKEEVRHCLSRYSTHNHIKFGLEYSAEGCGKYKKIH